MKKVFNNLIHKNNTQRTIHLIIVALCLAMFVFSNIAFAKTPFKYNIISETKENSIVDTKSQKKLEFSMQETEVVFYNSKQVKVKDNKFSIDVSKLSGNTTIEFTNADGESVKFNYILSNKNGKLEDYELVTGKELNVFVTTHKKVQILYTDKEKNALSKLKNYLNKLPDSMLTSVKQIKMVPFSNTKNIAGTTKDGVIILYNFSKYSATTQKNIIYHEIAHAWANELMDKKIIDYDYSKYNEIVKKDNNYVSSYAKEFADHNSGKLSEDFADAIAFYYMNQAKFKKQYPNRTEYFNSLLSNSK